MARNRRGRYVKPHGFKCEKCQDRGYLCNLPGIGYLRPCDCKLGRMIAEQMDAARTNLQIHRKLSKDGVLTRV